MSVSRFLQHFFQCLHSLSDVLHKAGVVSQKVCPLLSSLLIVSDGTELLLLLAVDESVAVKVVLDDMGLGAKAIAQRLQSVKLLVAQQHVDT